MNNPVPCEDRWQPTSFLFSRLSTFLLSGTNLLLKQTTQAYTHAVLWSSTHGDGADYSLPLQDQFAHADQVLGDFGEALFTLVSDESGPVNQILIDLFQSFLIVLTELHLETNTHGSVTG